MIQNALLVCCTLVTYTRIYVIQVEALYNFSDQNGSLDKKYWEALVHKVDLKCYKSRFVILCCFQELWLTSAVASANGGTRTNRTVAPSVLLQIHCQLQLITWETFALTLCSTFNLCPVCQEKGLHFWCVSAKQIWRWHRSLLGKGKQETSLNMIPMVLKGCRVTFGLVLGALVFLDNFRLIFWFC